VNEPLELIFTYAPLGLLAVVLLVGVVLAVVRWQRHPGVSLLTLLGCAVLLFVLVVGTALDRWIWSQTQEGWSFEFARALSRALSWVRVLINAAGYGLLFWAIFGWRQRQRPAYDERRHDEPRYDEPRPGRRFGPPGEGERGSEEVRRSDY
jgi:hypothetical protein